MGHRYLADLELLRAAADEAADIALGYFRKDPRTWFKDGGSPVSEADMAVDQFLLEKLSAARPDYGWLSEEATDNPERLSRDRTFIVDPIDGTRAFLQGDSLWSISLAVVEAGRPVAGVVFAPVLERCFTAIAEGGLQVDGGPVEPVTVRQAIRPRFAGSRQYAKQLERQFDIRMHPRFVPSLAYRLALVAAGEIDVTIVRPGARDWDLAAADLLVQEAGARLADLSGERLRYNRPETEHPTLVATTPDLFDAAAQSIRATG